LKLARSNGFARLADDSFVGENQEEEGVAKPNAEEMGCTS
jgi:hypothetical protein